MKGYALHIGINYCNTRDFAACQLDGAITDARRLREATAALSFDPINDDGLLLEEAATEAGILTAVRDAATTVRSGELLIVTFDGLGVLADLGETLDILQRRRGWVTYDHKVVSVAEMLEALSSAPKGARVLVVSSCCFIGSQVGTSSARARVSSARFARELHREGIQAMAARLALSRPRARRSTGPATVYHLAACGINQTIDDGNAATGSPFVGALIPLLKGTPMSFDSLVSELANQLNPDPQLEKFPADPAFDGAGPFLDEIAERRTA